MSNICHRCTGALVKISRIEAEIHVFEGTSDLTNPIAIGLVFSNGAMMRIRCAGDGESVIVDYEKLEEPGNWGEYGAGDVSSLAEHVPPSCFGSEIEDFSDVFCCGSLVGIAMRLEGDLTLCVWNYGDELYYGEVAKMTAQDWGDPLSYLRPRAEARPVNS